MWSLLGIQPTLQSLACRAVECKQGIPHHSSCTHVWKYTQEPLSSEHTKACMSMNTDTQSWTRHCSTCCVHVTWCMIKLLLLSNNVCVRAYWCWTADRWTFPWGTVGFPDHGSIVWERQPPSWCHDCSRHPSGGHCLKHSEGSMSAGFP